MLKVQVQKEENVCTHYLFSGLSFLIYWIKPTVVFEIFYDCPSNSRFTSSISPSQWSAEICHMFCDSCSTGYCDRCQIYVAYVSTSITSLKKIPAAIFVYWGKSNNVLILWILEVTGKDLLKVWVTLNWRKYLYVKTGGISYLLHCLLMKENNAIQEQQSFTGKWVSLTYILKQKNLIMIQSSAFLIHQTYHIFLHTAYTFSKKEDTAAGY